MDFADMQKHMVLRKTAASKYLKQLECRTVLVHRDSALKSKGWHCASCVIHMLLQYTNEQVQSCKETPQMSHRSSGSLMVAKTLQMPGVGDTFWLTPVKKPHDLSSDGAPTVAAHIRQHAGKVRELCLPESVSCSIADWRLRARYSHARHPRKM